MRYRVEFSNRAISQLEGIYTYIAAHAGANVARRFTDAITDYCQGLSVFPRRGVARDDLTPGLRTVGFRRRVSIAFEVSKDKVIAAGIFYGGQDIEAALGPKTDWD